MTLESLCWLSLAACGIHIVEEYLLDWPAWVRSLTGVYVSRSVFLSMNALLVVVGMGCASVANRLPWVGLAIPALMLINATVFHVGAFLWTRGRFSPGLITAVTLFYPMGIWCFKNAYDAGVLTAVTLVGSFGMGGALMALPLVLVVAGRLGAGRS